MEFCCVPHHQWSTKISIVGVSCHGLYWNWLIITRPFGEIWYTVLNSNFFFTTRFLRSLNVSSFKGLNLSTEVFWTFTVVNLLPIFVSLSLTPGVHQDLPSLLFSHSFNVAKNYIIRSLTLTPESMIQMNVCSLGWVINSNTVRSVDCVSLSFPESVNRWEPPSGTGSSHWRDGSTVVY